MPKTTLAFLKRFADHIRQVAGEETAARVMEGSQEISARSSSRQVALWMKGALARLDDLADPETRQRALAGCGADCAMINADSIAKARDRRKQFASLEEFIQAEVQAPVSGARLERTPEGLLLAYTPFALERPVRCYCPLLHGLPADQTIALEYCECSRSFVQRTWQGILEQPVEVELEESCLSGASECRFLIRIPPA